MESVSKENRIFQCVCLLAVVITSLPASGQTRAEGPWWPHPVWGPDDQAGGSNWITPNKIIEALSLVETGKVYELGQIYERSMPNPERFHRTYAMFIPSFPTSGPFGTNNLVSNDEFLCAQIGQVGTQFDGPAHIGKRMTMADGTITEVFYNGVTAEEMRDSFELRRLGVENVKPYITRGILLDIAGYKGMETLSIDYEVTLADVRGALARQGMGNEEIQTGDALFLNYGWWHYWQEPEKYEGGFPGIGMEVAEWVVSRRVSMVGSDTANEVDPNPNSDLVIPVHQELIMKNGILFLEFMTFEELLADEVYEFLFIFTPLRLKGATGSPGRPIAIR